ncbi:MAG: WD40 repeat domain-containing serine/threonine protein kinase [Planctomycetota bacterium]
MKKAEGKIDLADNDPSDDDLDRIFLQLTGGSSAAELDPRAASAIEAVNMIARVRDHEQRETVRQFSQVFETASLGADDETSIPDTIGRFQIKRFLGKGGFGVVFLAHDPNLGRDIALKIPRAEAIITPELKSRFVREGKAAASLAHPKIVPVYESGQFESVCYLASEFIDGVTLADHIKSSDGMDCRSSAKIAAAISDAISHAHQRNVLHRDIKPANILMVDSSNNALEDRIRITDFGLAKDVSDGSLQTKSGALIGTPAYMSPEQARQQPATPASDLYAIGAVLYEMITGQPPFEADNLLAAIQSVIEKDPVPPSRINPDVPRDLEAICLKCLEKHPSNRYPSVFELGVDLNRFLDGQPVVARPVSNLEYLRRWIARNPLLATASSLAALATLALIVGMIIGLLLLDSANRQTTQSLKISNRALFESKISESKALRFHQSLSNYTERITVLEEAIGRSKQIEISDNNELALRSELVATLTKFSSKPQQVWPTAVAEGRRFKIDFSSDLKIHVVAIQGEVQVRSTTDNSMLQRIEMSKHIAATPKLSPNGNWLALTWQNLSVDNQKHNLKVIRIESGEEVLRKQLKRKSVVSFNHDSTELLLAEHESESIQRFDLESNKELSKLDLPKKFHSSLKPSPDGRHLAYVCSDGKQKSGRGSRLVIIDATNATLSYQSPQFRYFIPDLAWSDSGDRLAIAHPASISFVKFTKASGQFVSDFATSIRHRGDSLPKIELSPQGQLCMVTYTDQTSDFFDLASQTRIFETQKCGVRFGNDGSVGFASIGKPVEVWSIRRPQSYHCLKVATFGIDSIECQDNHVFASCYAEKRVYHRTLDRFNGKTGRTFNEQARSFVVDSSGDVFTCDAGGQVKRWRWTKSPPRPNRLSLSGYQVKKIFEKGLMSGMISQSGDSSILGFQIKNDFVVYDVDAETAKKTGLAFAGRWHDLNHDASLVAVGDELTSKTTVFSLSSRAPVATLPTSVGSRPTFSKNGDRLLVADFNGFGWYDTQTWKCLMRQESVPFNGRTASVNNDGSLFVVTSPRMIEVYSSQPAKPLLQIPIPTTASPASVAFSSDGQWIVMGDSDGRLHFWNLSELQQQVSTFVDVWN